MAFYYAPKYYNSNWSLYSSKRRRYEKYHKKFKYKKNKVVPIMR